jgi:hypothetical protein
MIVVKQSFNVSPGKHVVLLVGPGTDQIGHGARLRAGARTWLVTATMMATSGALQADLSGDEPLNERLELRIDGTGMGKAEFARTADFLGKIARLMPGMDLAAFVEQCGEGMEPLREFAQALRPVQSSMPPLALIDALTGGPK